MKVIRKSNLFTTAIVMLLTFGIIGFWGCENESIQDNANLEYLDLKTYDMKKMTSKDFKIFVKAVERFEINKIDGLYVIEETSGTEVNVSNQLFDCIKQSFERTNKYLKNRKLHNRIARLNTGDTEGVRTDCVAFALAGLGGVSVTNARNYIVSQHGTGGVPISEIENVIRHFYPSIIKSSTHRGGSGSIDNTIAWFYTSPTNGHMVNPQSYNSTTNKVTALDMQNMGTWFLNESDIVDYFSLP